MKDKNRYDRLLDSIEAERQAEEDYFLRLSSSKSVKERIAAGVLWYPVQINKQHYTIGEYVELELVPASGSAAMKSNNFKVGASAIFFLQKEERLEYRGTISMANRKKVRIILSADVIAKDYILKGSNMGIELIYDDRSYQVMKESVKAVKKSADPLVKILKMGLEHRLSQQQLKSAQDIVINDHLNQSQKSAILGTIGAEYVGVIHGPPGTGKTTTLVELVLQMTRQGQKVLVTAPSNGAVDLLARSLNEATVRVVRIGNVTRIGDSIADLCLDEKMRNHKEWQHIKQVKIEAEEAHREASKYKRKFGATERQNRGLMYKEARQLKKWARELEDRLTDKIIDEAQVICATLIGSAHKSIAHLRFDVVIIDEASQALEPESWTAILRGNKVVMAGDHQQLPPTVKSDKAKAMSFDTTILDLLIKRQEAIYMLDTQYRMHPAILGFSNELFYDNKLMSGDEIINRQSPFMEEPLLYIDTSGCGFDEEVNAETQSKSNKQEYYIIREHILSIMPQLADNSIGLISPYRNQVRVMRQELEQDKDLRILDIEINSIDGFQGQEKDVIYLSLVRSNDQGELGFLRDYRRLNVAMTRARYKLVIVGDMSTLGADPHYLHLADHIEKHGRYRSAWEYMSY